MVALEAPQAAVCWSRIMAKIATQLTIGDYAKWRAGFDKATPFRQKAGMKNVQVYRDVDNPNAALVWSEVDDIAKARAVLESPELRIAMQQAGVVGARIHVIP
jgi:quinol monooxygenase YgiN